MSDRDKVIEIVKHLPEEKMVFILSYLQGLEDGMDEEPNDDTLEALEESEQKLKDGTIERFSGSTEDLFASILAEDD